LYLDRTVFAWRALRHLRTSKPDVVITRDIVVCAWLAVLSWLACVPVVYELHTLEQVMFDAEDALWADADSALAQSVRSVTATDFAGYQDDPSLPGRLYKRFIRRMENAALSRVALVLALTAAMERRLRREFAVAETRAVPSGHLLRPVLPSNRRDQRLKLGLEPDRRIAIYAGLSMHGKGLDLVFAVAQHLPPDCMILVLGGDAVICAKLAALARKLDLSQLAIVPRVPHESVADYLCAADIGLLLYPPSRYLAEFSSPMKLFEYFACGLPVIATALPSLREVVMDGVNGVVVAPDDPGAIAALIAGTVRDVALLDRLGAAARACAARYDYAQRARQIDESIRLCLARRAAQRESQCSST
jgi:glycosyltransferase involved in cell wall biosynthesis